MNNRVLEQTFIYFRFVESEGKFQPIQQYGIQAGMLNHTGK